MEQNYVTVTLSLYVSACDRQIHRPRNRPYRCDVVTRDLNVHSLANLNLYEPKLRNSKQRIKLKSKYKTATRELVASFKRWL